MNRILLAAMLVAVCLIVAGCAAVRQGAQRQFTEAGQLANRTLEGAGQVPLHITPPEQLLERIPAARVANAGVQGTGKLINNATR